MKLLIRIVASTVAAAALFYVGTHIDSWGKNEAVPTAASASLEPAPAESAPSESTSSEAIWRNRPTPITREDLIAAIDSGNLDAVIEAFNAIGPMSWPGDAVTWARYKDEIPPLVRAIWEEDRAAVPALRWDVATKDVVRVEAAGILVYAHLNGVIDIDVPTVRAFLLSKVGGEDRAVEMRALLTLGAIGDPRDIPLLVAVAESETPNRLRPAVLALADMCVPEAREALINLRTRLSDPEMTAYVAEVLADVEAQREFWDAWCARRIQRGGAGCQ